MKNKKRVMANLRRRLHRHTANTISIWANNGDGIQARKAILSAERILEFISAELDLAYDEGLCYKAKL